MGWAVTIAALGVAFMVAGSLLAARDVRSAQTFNSIVASPYAAFLIAGTGAGMLIAAIGLVGILH